MAEEDWNRGKVESVGTGRVPQRKPTSLGFAISIFPTHWSSPEPSMALAAPPLLSATEVRELGFIVWCPSIDTDSSAGRRLGAPSFDGDPWFGTRSGFLSPRVLPLLMIRGTTAIITASNPERSRDARVPFTRACK